MNSHLAPTGTISTALCAVADDPHHTLVDRKKWTIEPESSEIDSNGAGTSLEFARAHSLTVRPCQVHQTRAAFRVDGMRSIHSDREVGVRHLYRVGQALRVTLFPSSRIPPSVSRIEPVHHHDAVSTLVSSVRWFG